MDLRMGGMHGPVGPRAASGGIVGDDGAAA